MIPDKLDKFLRKCSHCDADIVWVIEDGERMPVTAEPQANGNLALTPSGRELIVGRPTELAAKGMRAQGVPTFLAHRLTCPRAADWSKATGGYRYAKPSRGGVRRKAATPARRKR